MGHEQDSINELVPAKLLKDAGEKSSLVRPRITTFANLRETVSCIKKKHLLIDENNIVVFVFFSGWGGRGAHQLRPETSTQQQYCFPPAHLHFNWMKITDGGPLRGLGTGRKWGSRKLEQLARAKERREGDGEPTLCIHAHTVKSNAAFHIRYFYHFGSLT